MLKICPQVASYEDVSIRISFCFLMYPCIRWEMMGLVFLQHTTDHIFIDQAQLRCSQRREIRSASG